MATTAVSQRLGCDPRARLLAAADAYCTKTEARPHRAPLAPADAADYLRAEAKVGRLDRIASGRSSAQRDTGRV